MHTGTGLKCQRIIASIFQLAGIKDARAKIVGSNNPLNIVRATFKGLTTQVGIIIHSYSVALCIKTALQKEQI